jgi:hypothetical protein
MPKIFDYDVALSFSGADRAYVEQVASLIRYFGYSVFYDAWEQHRLWGEDLYAYFGDVYAKKARYCLIFISSSYLERAWPQHERRFAQSRQLFSKKHYLLPVVLEQVEVPGIPRTLGTLDARGRSPSFVAVAIAKKLGSFPSSATPASAASCYEYILKKQISCRLSVAGDFTFRAFHKLLYLGPRLFYRFGFYEDSPVGRPLQLTHLRARDRKGPLSIEITRDFDANKHISIALREPIRFGDEIEVFYSYSCVDYYGSTQSSRRYTYTVGNVLDFSFALRLARGERFTASTVRRCFQAERVEFDHRVTKGGAAEQLIFTAREPPRGTRYEVDFNASPA